MPSITGQFGCPTQVESDSFYAARPQGSMDDSFLNQYIESVIVPLYPNMNKTAIFDPTSEKLNQGPIILKLDAGPGRIVLSAAILLKREELFERGLIILMGLPNATRVQQEMDALYGPLSQLRMLVAKRLSKRSYGSEARQGEMENANKLQP